MAPAQVNSWFSKSFLYELLSWEKPDTVLWHEESEFKQLEHFLNHLISQHSRLRQCSLKIPFSVEIWTRKKPIIRVSLTNGKVNIESRIVPFSCKEFPFKSIKCQTKFTNFVPYNWKQYLFLWNFLESLLLENGMKEVWYLNKILISSPHHQYK